MKHFLLALPLAAAMMTAAIAFAQTPAPAETAPAQAAPAKQETAPAGQGTAQPGGGDCVDLSARGAPSGETVAEGESETPPASGPHSGTAPGGAGSSGWTGGLGGSDIGTSQAKELDTSPQQDHPAVATGLDPISGKTAVEGPQAPPEPQPKTAAAATDC